MKTSFKNGISPEIQAETPAAFLGKFSTAAAVAVALGGAIALFSWWSRVPSTRSFLSLKPDVALGFVLAGVSLRVFDWKGLGSGPPPLT